MSLDDHMVVAGQRRGQMEGFLSHSSLSFHSPGRAHVSQNAEEISN